MKKVTIYDVAREAGVSLATVSRVINNSGLVKEKTKLKVEEVINRLDFKPNEIARGLATSRSTTIAVVFPEVLFTHVDEIISGIADVSRLYDYNIVLHTMTEMGEDPVQVLVERLVKNRVDGAIIFASDLTPKNIEAFSKYGISIVVVGPEVLEGASTVYANVKNTLLNYLSKIDLQAKSKLLYVDTNNSIVDVQVIKDIMESKQIKDLSISLNHVHIPTDYLDSVDELRQYITDQDVKMVICDNPKQAYAVVQLALEANRKIPEDIQVLSLLDASFNVMSKPEITSVVISIYDIGAIAVRQMTKILEKVETSTIHIEIPCRMEVRKTTKN